MSDLGVTGTCAFNPAHFKKWWELRQIDTLQEALSRYKIDEAGSDFCGEVDNIIAEFGLWQEASLLTEKDPLTESAPEEYSSDTNSLYNILRSRVFGKTKNTPSRLLVAGSIQSGKTGSYTELIKALLDRAGVEGSPHNYIVIVLAGVHNKLRNQTQERLDADLKKYTDQNANPPKIHWLTSVDKDIAKSAAKTIHKNYETSYIAVIKKVKTRLNAAISILEEVTDGNKFGIIIIDDECDQITPDEEKNPKVNSSRVAKLLWGDKESTAYNWRRPAKFPAGVVYIGYSATPYGNILLDFDRDRSMYPETYMHVLTEGENYMGYDHYWPVGDSTAEASTVDVLKVPKSEIDTRNKNSVNTKFKVEDTNLEKAVLWFFAAAAIKRERRKLGHIDKRDRHTSMLVNTHTKIADHAGMHTAINSFVTELKNTWTSSPDKVLEMLTALWHTCTPTSSGTKQFSTPEESEEAAKQAWTNNLTTVFNNVQVVCDNSKSKARLKYPKDDTTDTPPAPYEAEEIVEVIAVGGYTLSRGITLRGLVSSYMSRNSAVYYDSYLQLSRWFGYRRGYKDLTRLWLSNTASTAYAAIASADRRFKEAIRSASNDPEGPFGHGRIFLACIDDAAPSRTMDSYMRSTMFHPNTPHGPNLFGATPGWDDASVTKFESSPPTGDHILEFLRAYKGPDNKVVNQLIEFIEGLSALKDTQWDVRSQKPKSQEQSHFSRDSKPHQNGQDVWYVKTTTDPIWRESLTCPTLIYAPVRVTAPPGSAGAPRTDWIVAVLFEKAYGYGAVYQNACARKILTENHEEGADE